MKKPERKIVLNIEIEADSWEYALTAATDAVQCLRSKITIDSISCDRRAYDYRMNARSNYTASVGDDYHKQLQGYLKKMKSPLGHSKSTED